MKPSIKHTIAIASLAAASQYAHALPLVTFGADSAVSAATPAVTFDANTALQNHWSEHGVVVSYVGSPLNNGCGYQGLDCYDSPLDLGGNFSGNFMATGGAGAYLSVRRADGADFFALEFTAGSLYVNPYLPSPVNVFGYWNTFNDGALTGSGNFSQASGTVVGLADAAGFDELRYFAFA